MIKKTANILRKILPFPIYRFLLRSTRWPPVGKVKFHNLRRLVPISKVWGVDRGQPLDRFYIENFLSDNSNTLRVEYWKLEVIIIHINSEAIAFYKAMCCIW
jgi:hypothetical protein